MLNFKKNYSSVDEEFMKIRIVGFYNEVTIFVLLIKTLLNY